MAVIQLLKDGKPVSGEATVKPGKVQSFKKEEKYSSLTEQFKAGFGSKEERAKIKNKPGLDLGDLAGFAGDIPAIAGSILGGAAAGGATLGGGAIAGASAGAAAGDLVRTGIGKLMGMQKDKGLGSALKSAAGEAALTGGTLGVFKGVGGIANKARKILPEGQGLLTGKPAEAFKRVQESPTAREYFGGDKTVKDLAKMVSQGVKNVEKSSVELIKGARKTELSKTPVVAVESVVSKLKSAIKSRSNIPFVQDAKGKWVPKITEGVKRMATTGDPSEIQYYQKILNHLSGLGKKSLTEKEADALLRRIPTLGIPAGKDTAPQGAQWVTGEMTDFVGSKLPKKFRASKQQFSQLKGILEEMQTAVGAEKGGRLTPKIERKMVKKLTNLMQDISKYGGDDAVAEFEKLTGVPIQDAISGILLRTGNTQVLRGISAAQGSIGALGGMAGFGLGGPLGAAAGLTTGLGMVSPSIQGRIASEVGSRAPGIAKTFNKAAQPAALTVAELLRRLFAR